MNNINKIINCGVNWESIPTNAAEIYWYVFKTNRPKATNVVGISTNDENLPLNKNSNATPITNPTNKT